MNDEHTQNPLQPAEVLTWLIPRVALWLELDPMEINISQPISSYGLDSLSAVTLSVYLEDDLGIHLDTAVLWDHPTLENLAMHLSDVMAQSGITALPSEKAA